jgi:GrpB-like predicted nucleotidyltransferase (UPF0157 family)
MRIDHIGSTAVPGLAAKPIIDVQISVGSLEPPDAFREPLKRLGYVFRADNPELTKRCFRVSRPGAGARMSRCAESAASASSSHCCSETSWEPMRIGRRFADLKLALAERHTDDRVRYTESKRSFTCEALAAADEWAQRTGWLSGPSDA